MATRSTAGFRYTAEEPSIAALPGMLDRTHPGRRVLKAYAMTGWRLGWGLFQPRSRHTRAADVQSNTCTASFVQEAGLAAQRGPQEVVSA